MGYLRCRESVGRRCNSVQVKAPRIRHPSWLHVREKFLWGELAVWEEGLQRDVLWLAESLREGMLVALEKGLLD